MSKPSPEFDEQMMRRAIRLAMNGRGRVEPNPMVGCVIVKNGRVIGEGYHAQFGGPHAEPNALAACSESPEGATAYVTLEPCCHRNKKTPPCTLRLIEAKVARVVVGTLDPNPEVNGKGLAMLRSGGIEVAGPLLKRSAKQLIAPFLKWVVTGKPYVTLKWAETADGRVAGAGGSPIRITNPSSDRHVHLLRSRCEGIMVGINTVLADDPLLTVRDVPSLRRPARLVLDTHLRIPVSCKLVQTGNIAPTRVFCSAGAVLDNREKSDQLLDYDVVADDSELDAEGRIQLDRSWPDVEQHLLVEPGPTLAKSFMPLADRIWVFRSPNALNVEDAPRATPIWDQYARVAELEIAGDRLTEYLNRDSAFYFSPESSADFVLATESPAP